MKKIITRKIIVSKENKVTLSWIWGDIFLPDSTEIIALPVRHYGE